MQEPQPGCDGLPRAYGAEVGVERSRFYDVPGIEQVVRVADRLDGPEELHRLRVVHQRKQLRSCPAVTVLPDSDPP